MAYSAAQASPLILADSDIELLRLFNMDEQIRSYLCQMQRYQAAIKAVKTKLEILDEEFQVNRDYDPIHHIESRLKTPKSIIDKLTRRGYPVSLDSIKNNLYDVAGVRVICNYVDDARQIAQMLTSQDDVTIVEIKDYISNPKPNGYRSLHVIISVPVFLASTMVYMPVEVQIRTVAMDYWASLEHRLRYKTKEHIPADLYQRMNRCAEDLARIEEEMQAIHSAVRSNGDGNGKKLQEGKGNPDQQGHNGDVACQ